MAVCQKILLAVALFAIPALATHVAVLETGADVTVKDRVTLSDRQYLTNVLREQAVKELPASQNFTIMTRENINAMLPPGKAIEDCEGSCLAETGRNIAADYICQARVGSFGSKLTLSAELYETAGNKLVASFNGYGIDVEELLNVIKTNSQDFFRSVKDGFADLAEVPNTETAVVNFDPVEEIRAEEPEIEKNTPEESQTAEIELKEPKMEKSREDITYDGLDDKKSSPRVGESVPANVENKNSGVVRWVVLGVSAAVGVTGAALAVVGNNQAKDAAATNYFVNEVEFNDARDKAKSGQTLRSVGVGLAIVGAVGVGISFAF